MSPETAEWLKGPELVEWLEGLQVISADELKTQVGTRWESRVRAWRDGGAANVYTADRFLCSRGVCLGEVPDDFWREPPPKTTNEVSPELHDRIVALHELGWSYADIGRILGCDKKTARSHVLKQESSAVAS